MKSVLLPLVWSFLAGTVPALSAGEPVLVHVRVESGRAILVTNDGVSPVSRFRGVPPFLGAGHLEVAPASRATLVFRGVGSWVLEGPAILSWQMPGGPDGLRIEVNVINRADIEVREHPMRLDMPNAWRIELPAGAFSLYRLGGSGNEIVHRAGLPARLSWLGGESAMAPLEIHMGTSYRMRGAPAIAVRPDRSAHAPGWQSSAWPWGAGGIGGVPDITLAGAPAWEETGWPWGDTEISGSPEASAAPGDDSTTPGDSPGPAPWEHWDWPWVAPEVDSTVKPLGAAEPAADVPPAPEDGPEPDGSEPALDPEQAPDPEASPAQEPAPESGAQPMAAPVEVTLIGPTGGPALELVAEPAGEIAQPETTDMPPVSAETPKASEPSPEQPAPPPVDPPVASERSILKPSDIPHEEPKLTPHEKPKGTPQPPAYDSALWRGVPEDMLVNHGSFRRQAGPDFHIEPNGKRGWVITIDEDAPQPYWYFSRRLDVRLFPGSLLKVDHQGYLLHHEGLVRILSGDLERHF